MGTEFVTGLAIIAFVISFISLRRTRNLTKRLSELEAFLVGIDAAPPSVAVPNQPTDPEIALPEAAPQSAGWGPTRAKPGAMLAGLAAWIRANWIYPVAGAALIMAAVYLVQYSIERDLLSPQARIALALGLGGFLIGAGEVIRRRWGDEDSSARLLPSTLSGAGIVTLFAAVLAAFHLYEMLSPTMTLAGLVAVAALAMALGWVHGPLLAAIGVLAGALAPFLLVARGQPQEMLYGYFGLIAILGLGIDGFKRWGWISVLSVVAPIAGGVMIHLSGASAFGVALLVLLVAVLAQALPNGTAIPTNKGARISQWRTARPEGATLVAALALVLTCGVLVMLQAPLISLLSLGVLALIVPLWTRYAPALADLIVLPVLALLVSIFELGVGSQMRVAFSPLETAWLPFAVVALAALAGWAMLWRGRQETGRVRDFWVLVGIGYPGAVIAAFELFWRLSDRIDPYTWALTAMAMAAAYVAVTLWAVRREAGQGLLLGASAAAAFAMIALALILTLSLSALTIALAVLMVSAAMMDRRFNIPALGWFLALASMALSWRIIVDPGLSWLLGWDGSGGATSFEVVISLMAALGGPLVTVLLLAGLPPTKQRGWTGMVVETGLSGLIPVALMIVFARFLGGALSIHAHLGLQAGVFMSLAWVQWQRAQRSPDSRILSLVRYGLSLIFAAGAVLLVGVTATLFSPLFSQGFLGDPVKGTKIVNDLILAYALPAGILLWILRAHKSRAATVGRVGAGLLLAYWIAATIRHIWQGANGMAVSTGFAQGELYAYTVALLIAGAAALGSALHLGRSGLRIVGLALIAMAAAKAFLIDASGLTGLIRVGAFLALGVSLAGLAWLNAWVSARVDSQRNTD